MEVTQLCKIKEIDWQTDLSACTDNKGLSGAVANRPASAPIIVAEWPRNSHELVRISLDRFNTRFTVDIRAWWRDGNGVFKPGRNGLTLTVKHLPKLTDGLSRALQRAQILGLLEPVAKDRTAAERQRRYRQRRNGHASITHQIASLPWSNPPRADGREHDRPGTSRRAPATIPHWTPAHDDREPGPMLADQHGSGAAGMKHR